LIKKYRKDQDTNATSNILYKENILKC
jgi:hypothetical protein